VRLAVAPDLQMHGRKLFAGGPSRRLTLTRPGVSPAGYLLLDFQVGDEAQADETPA